jgi:hypothetical protein
MRKEDNLLLVTLENAFFGCFQRQQDVEYFTVSIFRSNVKRRISSSINLVNIVQTKRNI